MEVEVGKLYHYKGNIVRCTAKWAQGVWHTYSFDDGSSFNGDPNPLFENGSLKEVDVPKVKINNKIPPWTPKTNGTPSES